LCCHLNNLLSIFLDQLSGTLLDQNQVRSAVEGVKEVIVASTNRRIERTERARAEDFDSEEEELLREENEQEDEIFDQVSYLNTQSF
jgi:importin-5